MNSDNDLLSGVRALVKNGSSLKKKTRYSVPRHVTGRYMQSVMNDYKKRPSTDIDFLSALDNHYDETELKSLVDHFSKYAEPGTEEGLKLGAYLTYQMIERSLGNEYKPSSEAAEMAKDEIERQRKEWLPNQKAFRSGNGDLSIEWIKDFQNAGIINIDNPDFLEVIEFGSALAARLYEMQAYVDWMKKN